MKAILAALILLTISTNAFAATINKEGDIRPFADSVMESLVKDGFQSAYLKLKPYTMIPETEFDASLLQSTAQRDQYGARYGKTIGYEFISSQKAGESLIKLQYIEKREKNPLVWLFFFYKADAGWTLNSFIWHDKVPAAFE